MNIRLQDSVIEKYFTTTDLGLSASLLNKGFELVQLDKLNPKKVQFIFLKRAGINKTINDYWSDKLNVNPRTYFDNIKLLKNRLYSN